MHIFPVFWVQFAHTRPHVWNAGPQHNGMAWYRTEWNEMKWEWGMVMGVWGKGGELPLLCCIIAG